MVDFIKSLLGEFDPTAFLPDLWAIFGNLDTALRVVVLRFDLKGSLRKESK